MSLPFNILNAYTETHNMKPPTVPLPAEPSSTFNHRSIQRDNREYDFSKERYAKHMCKVSLVIAQQTFYISTYQVPYGEDEAINGVIISRTQIRV